MASFVKKKERFPNRQFYSSNHIVENHLHKSLPFLKRTQPSLKDIEMDPASAILAFMGMAGGAYYLYNKDLPKDLKDLPKDQKDLTKDQKDLTKDQETLIDNLIEESIIMGMAGGAYYLYNRDLPKDLKDLPKDQNDLPNDLTDLANDQKGLTMDQMNKYFL